MHNVDKPVAGTVEGALGGATNTVSPRAPALSGCGLTWPEGATAEHAAVTGADARVRLGADVTGPTFIARTRGTRLADYARSIGLSAGVTERIIRLCPNVLRDNMRLDPVEDDVYRRAYKLYRGLHDVTLHELRRTVTGGAYVEFSEGWSGYFATGKGMVPPPSEGQIFRGYLIELEVPGHLIDGIQGEYWKKMLRESPETFNLVNELKPKDVPDMTPYISRIGFFGPDKVVKYHAYEALFTPDGERTPLAMKLDAQMAPKVSKPG